MPQPDPPKEAVEEAIALGEERTGRSANRELFAEIVGVAAPAIRKQRDEELRGRLLSDEMLDAVTEAAFGPYAGPLPRAKLREVLLVALGFTKPLDSIFEEADGA